MGRNYNWEQGVKDGSQGTDAAYSDNEDYSNGYVAGVRREIEKNLERENEAIYEEQQRYEEYAKEEQDRQQPPCGMVTGFENSPTIVERVEKKLSFKNWCKEVRALAPEYGQDNVEVESLIDYYHEKLSPAETLEDLKQELAYQRRNGLM